MVGQVTLVATCGFGEKVHHLRQLRALALARDPGQFQDTLFWVLQLLHTWGTITYTQAKQSDT